MHCLFARLEKRTWRKLKNEMTMLSDRVASPGASRKCSQGSAAFAADIHSRTGLTCPLSCPISATSERRTDGNLAALPEDHSYALTAQFFKWECFARIPHQSNINATGRNPVSGARHRLTRNSDLSQQHGNPWRWNPESHFRLIWENYDRAGYTMIFHARQFFRPVQRIGPDRFFA